MEKTGQRKKDKQVLEDAGERGYKGDDDDDDEDREEQTVSRGVYQS